MLAVGERVHRLGVCIHVLYVLGRSVVHHVDAEGEEDGQGDVEEAGL